MLVIKKLKNFEEERTLWPAYTSPDSFVTIIENPSEMEKQNFPP